MVNFLIKKILQLNTIHSLKEQLILHKKRIFNQLSRKDFFRMFRDFKCNKNLKPDKGITIDVAICCVDKDADVLPYCIDSVKKFISHDIDMIYLIAPKESIKLREIAKSKNCIFIDEDSIINIKKDEIKLIVNGVNRSGWIFQQLLKLHVDLVSSKEYIFIIDSDTILTNPKTLISRGKTIFDFSDEFHTPYYKSFEKLTGLKHKLPISLVSHMMLFEKSKLEALRNHVENKFKEKFVEVILKNLDRNETSSFSEFETYGNFSLQCYKKFHLKYWFNNAYKHIYLKNINNLIQKNQNDLMQSISLHNYLK